MRYAKRLLRALLSLCALALLASPGQAQKAATPRRCDPTSETAKAQRTGDEVRAHNGAAGEECRAEEGSGVDDESPAQAYRLLQSNGLLVEGAYHQEPGEVQHTFAIRHTRAGGWAAAFSQEWPLRSEKHQLSFTLPAQLAAGTETGRGIGDLTLEYSYALVGNSRTRLTIAPGVGLFMPTGSVRKQLGVGALGVEVKVPVSVMLAKRFGMHTTVGASYTPRARNEAGERASLVGYEFGQSFVWYTRPRLNMLVDAVWERTEAVTGAGLKAREREFFVSPGVRWAHRLKGGLDIIPGVALPIGFGPSRGDHSVLFYLAFEHPFKKRRE